MINSNTKLEDLLIQENYDQIYRMYKSLFDLKNTSIDEVKLIYISLVSLAKYDETEQLLLELASLNNLNLAVIYFLLAHLYFLTGKLGNTSKYLIKSLEMDSEFLVSKYFYLALSQIDETFDQIDVNELIVSYPLDPYFKFFYCLKNKGSLNADFSEQLVLLRQLYNRLADIIESNDPISEFLEYLPTLIK